MFTLERKTLRSSQTSIYPTLEIGKEDDEHEREANQIADKVMRKCDSNCPDEEDKGKMTDGDTKVQMMHDSEEEKEKMTAGGNKVQMMVDSPLTIRKMTTGSEAGRKASENVEKGINSTKGNGHSLSPEMQHEMGSKMGADFSNVKIHTNDYAVQMNKEVGAKAFTHGSDIYFNSNQYNPSSKEGKHLLAHELTHTVQQGETVERTVQCKCSNCTGDKNSKIQCTKINTSSSIYRKKIQRIPQNPTGTPFDATIIPWSAALHESADISSKTLADLPRNHKVSVLGGKAWIHVKTTFEEKTLEGYVSHELLRKVETTSGQENTQSRNNNYQRNGFLVDEYGGIELDLNYAPPMENWHPLGLLNDGSLYFNPKEPERVVIKRKGITPRMIAQEMYRDADKHISDMGVEWFDTDGELKSDTVIPVGRYVRLQFAYYPYFLQNLYDKSVPITSRESWGAREHEPHEPGVHEYEEITGSLQDYYTDITIHHAGNSGYKTMKEVQDKHMDGKGDKADIGYHYGINMSGEIFEGRPIDVKGAHVCKGNTGVIGIVFLADLDTQEAGFDWGDDELTDVMESSLLNLIHFLLGKYPKIKHLGGHKEFNPQRSCPGDLVMAKMSSWRTSTGLTEPKPIDADCPGDD